MRAFWLALGFLTRLPVPCVEPDASLAGRSVLYYPLVGLILGALLAGFAALFPPGRDLLAAALVLFLWVWLTGALHLDGLADSADAWLGGHGRRERMLAIMKDPSSGPAGVAAVVTLLIVKFAALTLLIEARESLVLLVIPMLARAAVPLLFLTTAYVRPQGLGESQARHLPRRAAGLVVAAAVLATAAGLGMRTGLSVLAAAAAGFVGLRRLMVKHLGGTTGDTGWRADRVHRVHGARRCRCAGRAGAWCLREKEKASAPTGRRAAPARARLARGAV